MSTDPKHQPRPEPSVPHARTRRPVHLSSASGSPALLPLHGGHVTAEWDATAAAPADPPAARARLAGLPSRLPFWLLQPVRFQYGLGNEISTHGDVYSYGILLLEMFTGKRPTENEFSEAMGLRKYVQMALPDRMSAIMDQQLLMEIEDGESATSNSKLRIFLHRFDSASWDFLFGGAAHGACFNWRCSKRVASN